MASPRVPILVIDDNPSKRFALTSVLVELGYDIVEADSGPAGLRCVMSQNFAVILLDVRMPGMDGFETAALIRQRRESEMTPIIFVTAYSSDEFSADRYVEGAVDFMFAPIEPDELRAKVSVFANLYLQAERLASQARAVKASADHLTLLTDAAPVGIFQTDTENRYVYTNPCWSSLTGISAEDALGQPWDCILHSSQRDRVSEEVASRDLDPKNLFRRFEIRPPDSEARTVLVSSKSVPGPGGGVIGGVGTLSDVTDEVKAEAALSAARDEATQASQMKSDFLANMSHEIRTPMNGVMGMAELLLETNLNEQQRDLAQTVRDSGDALLSIINDILDFSKIEAGMLQIEKVRFDVRTTVADVVDLLGAAATRKALTFRAAVDSSVPPVIDGDPGRVRQILINLIGNAIKFTATGEIVVRVTLDDSGPEVILRFEVSDTGVGVPPDKIATIFQPFVQADSSTAREYGGTGLGLAICSQLVWLMGGDCGLISATGTGSTFWFTIPASVRPPQPADHASGDPGAPVKGTSGEVGSSEREELPRFDRSVPSGHGPNGARLLLVEDNLINQKVALTMLSGAGYHVDAVLDGAAAVKAAASQSYDIILMDCQLPVLSGYEATAAIRELDGANKHTPIIAMTAGARPEDEARCWAEGMDGYLPKPVSKHALLTLVSTSLKPARV
jgi:PAS domain S-box-containing protein